LTNTIQIISIFESSHRSSHLVW